MTDRLPESGEGLNVAGQVGRILDALVTPEGAVREEEFHALLEERMRDEERDLAPFVLTVVRTPEALKSFLTWFIDEGGASSVLPLVMQRFDKVAAQTVLGDSMQRAAAQHEDAYLQRIAAALGTVSTEPRSDAPRIGTYVNVHTKSQNSPMFFMQGATQFIIATSRQEMNEARADAEIPAEFDMPIRAIISPRAVSAAIAIREHFDHARTHFAEKVRECYEHLPERIDTHWREERDLLRAIEFYGDTATVPQQLHDDAKFVAAELKTLRRVQLTLAYYLGDVGFLLETLRQKDIELGDEGLRIRADSLAGDDAADLERRMERILQAIERNHQEMTRVRELKRVRGDALRELPTLPLRAEYNQDFLRDGDVVVWRGAHYRIGRCGDDPESVMRTTPERCVEAIRNARVIGIEHARALQFYYDERAAPEAAAKREAQDEAPATHEEAATDVPVAEQGGLDEDPEVSDLRLQVALHTFDGSTPLPQEVMEEASKEQVLLRPYLVLLLKQLCDLAGVTHGAVVPAESFGMRELPGRMAIFLQQMLQEAGIASRLVECTMQGESRLVIEVHPGASKVPPRALDGQSVILIDPLILTAAGDGVRLDRGLYWTSELLESEDGYLIGTSGGDYEIADSMLLTTDEEDQPVRVPLVNTVLQPQLPTSMYSGETIRRKAQGAEILVPREAAEEVDLDAFFSAYLGESPVVAEEQAAPDRRSTAPGTVPVPVPVLPAAYDGDATVAVRPTRAALEAASVLPSDDPLRMASGRHDIRRLLAMDRDELSAYLETLGTQKRRPTGS